MKITRNIASVICAAGVMVAAGFVSYLQAEPLSTSRTGTTKWWLEQNQANARHDVKPMSCPICKTEWSKQTDASAKGINKPTVSAEKHLCNGCSMSVSTSGVGKGAQTAVTHSCSASKDASCCATVN
jgi:hypothetical protein